MSQLEKSLEINFIESTWVIFVLFSLTVATGSLSSCHFAESNWFADALLWRINKHLQMCFLFLLQEKCSRLQTWTSLLSLFLCSTKRSLLTGCWTTSSGLKSAILRKMRYARAATVWTKVCVGGTRFNILHSFFLFRNTVSGRSLAFVCGLDPHCFSM